MDRTKAIDMLTEVITDAACWVGHQPHNYREDAMEALRLLSEPVKVTQLTIAPIRAPFIPINKPHHNARPPGKRRRGKHARTHDRWSVHTMMTMNGIYNPHLVRHIIHPEPDGA